MGDDRPINEQTYEQADASLSMWNIVNDQMAVRRS